MLAIRSLLWGLLVTPTGVAGATLLRLALGAVVVRLTGVASPWYSHPLPMPVAVCAGAFLCLGLIAAAVARRATFWSLFLDDWLWWSALSLLITAFAPAACMLFLVPALLAALVTAVAAAAPLRAAPRAWEVVALVALFGASWFWVSFTRGADYTALGADLGPMVGFAVGMAGTALTPLWHYRNPTNGNAAGPWWG
jgi:hypothetical protein